MYCSGKIQQKKIGAICFKYRKYRDKAQKWKIASAICLCFFFFVLFNRIRERYGFYESIKEIALNLTLVAFIHLFILYLAQRKVPKQR